MRIRFTYRGRPVAVYSEIDLVPRIDDVVIATTVEGGADMLTTAEVRDDMYFVRQVVWRLQDNRETAVDVVLDKYDIP